MPKWLKALSGVSEEGDGSFSCVCRRLSLSVEFPLRVFYLPSFEFASSGESLLLCDNGQLHIHIPLLKFFDKIAHHMSVVSAYVSLWLCGFVALCVRMCVAGTNKVEDTMS